MKKTILLILALFAFYLGKATEKDTLVKMDAKVQLISKHYQEEIVLRWAPTDAKWWYYGIKEGFEISRREVSDPNSEYTVLEENYLPWSEDRMVQWYTDHPEDEAIIVALQTIHRNWEDTYYEGGGIEAMFEKNTVFNQRHQMTLLAADIHAIVADAAGLRYVDKTIENDKVYSYRVRYNKSKSHQAFSIVKNRSNFNKPVLFEVLEKENAIQLKWDKAMHQKHYTSYFIERSKDGKSYTRLNELPYIQALGEKISERKYMVYTDSIANYESYYYRLVGIDAFGDLSEPSVPELVKAMDRTPPEVGDLKAKKTDDEKQVALSWEHNDIKELGKVIVYKNSQLAKAELVCEFETNIKSTCIDENPQEGMNDYHLVLVDTVGNFAQSNRASVYFKDKTPPQPPVNLKADVDTMGRIILTWDDGPDNDILAYYIFSADHKGKNFIKLNPRKHHYRIYVDSVGTQLLTQKRYYKIAAMDRGGNIGEYSEILEVDRPDKIPPAPALFYNYRVEEEGVYMGLMASSSRDVVEHNLYRKKKGTNDWKIIKTYGKEVPPIYLDKEFESNITYTYKFLAKDNVGLESDEKPSKLTITASDIRTRYTPQLNLRKVDEGTEIALAGNIPGDNYRIEIIRSIKGGKFKSLTILQKGKSFIDRYKGKISDNIKPVTYKARILYKDGKRSKYSEAQSM